MKRYQKFILLIGIGLCLGGLCGCASSEDNSGVYGENPSLAVTSVAICNILDELNYENVVGVPETSGELPTQYQDLQTIGSPMNPDLEIISSIAPDLLLAPKSLESSLSESFTTAGISAKFVDLSSVEGMYTSIEELGALLNRQEEADALTSGYTQYIEEYQADIKENPRVLILMAFPGKFYLVATENSYVGNLVSLAGGVNVYDKETKGDSSGFSNVNPEDIVQTDPDYIMVFAHYAEEEAFAYMKKEFQENDVWQYFDAVGEGNIVYLPSTHFGMSASLSWTDALEYLKPILHGDTK